MIIYEKVYYNNAGKVEVDKTKSLTRLEATKALTDRGWNPTLLIELEAQTKTAKEFNLTMGVVLRLTNHPQAAKGAE
jgi:hypothetical protein